MFDEEMGLYYLRNRYLNVLHCRFINCDKYVGSSPYAYCVNSPINRSDESGMESAYTVIKNSMINCYAYAFRLTDGCVIKGDIRIPDLIQPGMLSKSHDVMDKNRDKFLSLEDYQKKLVTNVLNDASQMGVSVQQVDSGDGDSNEDSWIVALVIDYNPTTVLGISFWKHPRDYHWYRKESNGNWSHKSGHSNPSNVDANDQSITDPALCNRGRYNIFVGYFRVTKQYDLTMENVFR